MHTNGSPEPVFETDDDRIYFLTVLPVHYRICRPNFQQR